MTAPLVFSIAVVRRTSRSAIATPCGWERRRDRSRSTFPDGEHYQRIDTDPADRDVRPGRRHASTTPRRSSSTTSRAASSPAARIACASCIPYFGYSTMERAVRAGEIVTAKTRARLLSSIPMASRGTQVFLLDLHVASIAHYFEGGIRPVHVYGKSLVTAAARRLGGDDFVLACTDAGRAKWVESLANDLGVDGRVRLQAAARRRSETEVTGVSRAGRRQARRDLRRHDPHRRLADQGGAGVPRCRRRRDRRDRDARRCSPAIRSPRIRATGLFGQHRRHRQPPARRRARRASFSQVDSTAALLAEHLIQQVNRMKLIKVAVACVNQTPFAWDENFAHLRMAIEHARAEGVTMLCLPELAITGYGCEDAFFMDGLQDTAFAQLDALARADARAWSSRVGLPVYHEKALYNAAALLVDGAIVGFVAKQFLAGDGIHYEPRWFKPWPAGEVDVLERTDDDGSSGGFRSAISCSTSATSASASRSARTRGSRTGRASISRCAASTSCAIRRRATSRSASSRCASASSIEGSRAFGVAYLYANLLGNEAGRVIYDGGGLIASGGELRRARPPVLVPRRRAVDRGDRHRRQPPRAVAPRQPPPASRRRGRRSSRSPFVWPARKPEAPPTRASAAWEDSRVAARGGVRARRRARPVGLPAQEPRAGLRRVDVGRRRLGGVRGARRARGAARVRGARRRRRAAAPAVVPRLARRARQGGDATAAVGALLACAYQPTENSGAVTRSAAETVARRGRRRVPRDRRRRAVRGVRRDGRDARSAASSTWEHDDVALQNIQARVRAPSIWMLANVRGAVLLTTSNRSRGRGRLRDDGRRHRRRARAARRHRQDRSCATWLRWMETNGPVGLGPIPALGVDQRAAADRRAAPARRRRRPTRPTSCRTTCSRPSRTPRSATSTRRSRCSRSCCRAIREHAPAQLARVDRAVLPAVVPQPVEARAHRAELPPRRRNLDPRSWCRFPILSGGFERELAELRAYVAMGKAER